MAVKAKLRVVLMADDLTIAESEDEALWRRTFDAISTGSLPAVPADAVATSSIGVPPGQPDARERFAREVDVTTDDVEGACGPSSESPYLHLNPRYWEALKANTPPRGPGSVAAPVLAATLLVLWFRALELGATRVEDVHKVLATLGLQDRNTPRAIRNCSWLILRNNDTEVLVNPAEMTKAVALCRGYCLKQSPWGGRADG